MESGKQLERLIFFSDAVFAIAITLLILDIRLPDGLRDGEIGAELLALWPNYLGYVLSFWVIGIFWRAHHRTFGHVRRLDKKLISLNLIFLMSIAFMPFPASVAGEYGGTQAGAIFYSSCLMVTGILMVSLSLYVFRNERLAEPDLDHRSMRQGLVRAFSTPIICVFVISLSFVTPDYAMMGFIAVFVVPRVINRIVERRDSVDATG